MRGPNRFATTLLHSNLIAGMTTGGYHATFHRNQFPLQCERPRYTVCWVRIKTQPPLPKKFGCGNHCLHQISSLLLSNAWCIGFPNGALDSRWTVQCKWSSKENCKSMYTSRSAVLNAMLRSSSHCIRLLACTGLLTPWLCHSLLRQSLFSSHSKYPPHGHGVHVVHCS